MSLSFLSALLWYERSFLILAISSYSLGTFAKLQLLDISSLWDFTEFIHQVPFCHFCQLAEYGWSNIYWNHIFTFKSKQFRLLNNSDSSEFGFCLLVLSRQVTHISWLPPPFCSVSSLSSLYWERFLCSSSISDCETLSERPGKGYRLPC